MNHTLFLRHACAPGGAAMQITGYYAGKQQRMPYLHDGKEQAEARSRGGGRCESLHWSHFEDCSMNRRRDEEPRP